jgi:nucleotide-binding universal stress UspA family protein
MSVVVGTIMDRTRPAAPAFRTAHKIPLERILVGLDGSTASLDALRWAGLLTDAVSADITAVHAFMPPPAKTPSAERDRLRREAEERVIAWSAKVDTAAPVSSVLVDGRPDGLLSLAAQSADLLVVGTRGAGGFAHLHLGSVAHHLAHRSSVPLAIVPRGAAGDRVARIVVGVDGSTGSAAAVTFCATLAPMLGARVVAVYAFEPFAEWVPENDPRSWHRTAEADVHEWVAPIEAAGVRVQVDVQRDIDPVGALRRAVEAAPDTLAVVGARGLGGFTGRRRGRVPIQLVRHSDAVVVMVPTSEVRSDPRDNPSPRGTCSSRSPTPRRGRGSRSG